MYAAGKRQHRKLGSDRASFTLTGWIKADTTPIRKDRELYVKARHKVSDTESIEAKQKINAYSKGWQYFCLMMPAKIWGSTTISIQFDDNIGDLYIDGLELTKNDVQTRVYNTNGKMTSKHVAQKDTSYGYDNYSRTDRVTIPDGVVSSYTYNGSNENTKISTSLGPNTYMTYDRYGNLLTTASYDADAAVKNELYAQNRYTDDGNFQSAAVDNRGYTTSYNYDKATGSLLTKTLPKRSGTTTQIQYSYNQYGQMTRLAEGNRAVDYGCDSDGNLTSITRNGFRYDYTYDGFGNLINTKIAGTTVSTNSYAPNNGTHTGTAYADGSRTSQGRDAYGRVIRSYITDAGGTRHQIDATVYDNDGNVKKYTDTANSLTTEYDYDDAGRVARSVVKKENNSAYNGSRVQYAYSKGGKIANLSYDTGDGKIKSYVYTYAKDGLPEKSVFPDASCQTLSYDNLRSNSQKVYYPVKNAAAAKRLYTTAAFMEGQSSASSHKGTTALVKTYTNKHMT